MTETPLCWPNSQENGLRKDQGSLSPRPLGPFGILRAPKRFLISRSELKRLVNEAEADRTHRFEFEGNDVNSGQAGSTKNQSAWR